MWYAIVEAEDGYAIVFGSKEELKYVNAIIRRPLPTESRYGLRKSFVRALRRHFPKIDPMVPRLMYGTILLHGWNECAANELGDGRSADQIDFPETVVWLVRFLCTQAIRIDDEHGSRAVGPKDSRRIIERLRLEGRIARRQYMKQQRGVAA